MNSAPNKPGPASRSRRSRRRRWRRRPTFSTAQADNGFARLRFRCWSSAPAPARPRGQGPADEESMHTFGRTTYLASIPGPVDMHHARRPRSDRILRQPDQRRHRYHDSGLRRPGHAFGRPMFWSGDSRSPCTAQTRCTSNRPDARRLQGREHHGACRLDPRRPPRRHLRGRRHGPRHHDGQRPGLDRGGRLGYGETHISVPDSVPGISAFHLLTDEDRVFDQLGSGSARVRWTVEGEREDGTPFEFSGSTVTRRSTTSPTRRSSSRTPSCRASSTTGSRT